MPFLERFTVLSYNILADYLAIDHRSKLYFHIPRHILDWSWRKKKIIFELGLWSADILCFQVIIVIPLQGQVFHFIFPCFCRLNFITCISMKYAYRLLSILGEISKLFKL